MHEETWMQKTMRHAYDAAENILHFWFPSGIELSSKERISAFSDYGVRCARECPNKPYLLVDYTRIVLVPELVHYYARSLLKMKGLVIDAYRYGIQSGDPARVHISASVRSATGRGFGRSNFYPDEASARAA